MKPQNPFLITGYHSPEYFCDRTNETQRMLAALANNRNITLIAPRRMGKTGLIKNVFYNLRQRDPDVVTIYVDIFSTRNLSEFVQLFASSVLGQFESKADKAIDAVGRWFSGLRPVITFDEITGVPKFSIDVVPTKEEVTLKKIFDYIGASNKRCYIAIDEFQQITEYPEQGVEAALRSYIQFVGNASFVFSGSKQHVMQQMFLSAKRPFYQSTQTLSLDVIERGEYYRFAEAFFSVGARSLSREVFDYLYSKFEGHTWYVQSILNRLYTYSEAMDISLVNDAIDQIVGENEYPYQSLLQSYKSGAVKLLTAIAKEGLVSEINAGEFIAKHTLKAASSVNSSLKKLMENELVYKTTEGYIVYDRFMAVWLSRQP